MAVDGYMDELIDFVTREDDPRYDLIKIAIAHHRFVWIHPFTNGNGRTVRLFTYALLMKYGFRVETAQRILNPTAVFCNDREQYYNKLRRATSCSSFRKQASYRRSDSSPVTPTPRVKPPIRVCRGLSLLIQHPSSWR